MKCKGVTTFVLVEGVHSRQRKEMREVHEQTATGGCECSDRIEQRKAVVAYYRVRR